jgi:hypothetical protein
VSSKGIRRKNSERCTQTAQKLQKLGIFCYQRCLINGVAVTHSLTFNLFVVCLTTLLVAQTT